MLGITRATRGTFRRACSMSTRSSKTWPSALAEVSQTIRLPRRRKLRCRFVSCTTAGISIGDWNSLDWWIWDSEFDQCARGVANDVAGNMAGHFHVYKSTFRGSTISDLEIGNTEYFGIRDNVSIGSKAFFSAGGPTGANAQITLQGNTVLDPTSTPVHVLNPGPLFVIDNSFRYDGGAAVSQFAYPGSTRPHLLSSGQSVRLVEPDYDLAIARRRDVAQPGRRSHRGDHVNPDCESRSACRCAKRASDGHRASKRFDGAGH